jgi:ABC-type transport system substrate-binding protein
MRTVWDDSPWIFLYHQQDIYGVGSRVKDFKPTSEAIVSLADTTVTS